MKFQNLARLGLFTYLTSFSISAWAVRVSAIGHLSYENVRFNKDYILGGVGFGGAVEAQAIEITGGTDLLIGATMNYYSVSGKVADADASFSQFIFGPFAGVGVNATPKFTISSTLGYDFGLSGKSSIKAGSVEVSKDTKSYGSVVNEWKGMFQINSHVSGGLGLVWHAGSVEIPVTLNPVNATYIADFRGFAMRAMVGYTF